MIKDPKYGIPQLKKFPLPDARHVKSAIRFFNYVPPRYEKQLATAIIRRMKEYGMSFDDFTVGDENRFIKYVPKTYLAHYGVLGMHWGIRRYQPYPSGYSGDGKFTGSIKDQKRATKAAKKELKKNLRKVWYRGERTDFFRDEHVLPKGTKLFRATSTKEDNGTGPVYVSYALADREHYLGGWIRNRDNVATLYETEYKNTEDIRVPSRKELYSVIDSVVKSNEDDLKTIVNNHFALELSTIYNVPYKQLIAFANKSRSEDAVKKAIDSYKGKSLESAAFMAAQTFGVDESLKNKVIKELSSRGFNAMTDEASVGGQNDWSREGVDPLIVFDRSILEKKKTRESDPGDRFTSDIGYTSWRGKAKRSAQWSMDHDSDELYH